ncbi:MAG: Endonuclease III [Chlamydiales bacterium]|nr:Endonuclease III [Chlamydiales bacterium]MCH9619647.1 Endonuclease III [Chlamydiales bacterium]MCH9623253.1 Endonuclease III [Chlamydiales bacterium]
MNQKERVHQIQKILDHYFPDPEVPLNYTSSFTLLIAVLLSARCTDAMVNRVTPHLFAKASTPQQMAALPVSTIQGIIRPCGLSPQKAKRIQALSKIIEQEHGGEVPSSLEELEKLPGVGHKTASVVLNQAFGLPAFPVDTHIYRSARRWGLSKGKTVVAVEKDLKRLFDKSAWGKLHLQIILFARNYCPSRGHQKETCPICSLF